MIQVDQQSQKQFLENQILCYYANLTNTIQITRIQNIPNLAFERVVFPGQRILFESIPEAQLAVYVSTMGREMLLHEVACDRLRVSEHAGDLVLQH